MCVQKDICLIMQIIPEEINLAEEVHIEEEIIDDVSCPNCGMLVYDNDDFPCYWCNWPEENSEEDN